MRTGRADVTHRVPGSPSTQHMYLQRTVSVTPVKRRTQIKAKRTCVSEFCALTRALTAPTCLTEESLILFLSQIAPSLKEGHLFADP